MIDAETSSFDGELYDGNPTVFDDYIGGMTIIGNIYTDPDFWKKSGCFPLI